MGSPLAMSNGLPAALGRLRDDLAAVRLRLDVPGAEEARRVCRVACDACGRCAMDAAPGLITMVDNLPVVDYGAGGPASPEATYRCPTGAIQWVEGEQFTGEEPGVLPESPRPSQESLHA